MGSAILRIRLFGEVDLRRGEAPLPALESARGESLLAYLLLHREAPQPRQRLAFLLWPDSSESQARTNLRHLLHTLRRALPDADRFIEVTPRTLRWRPDAACWLDVAAFEEALSRAEGDEGDGAVGALREAVELYSGDLMPGAYEDWVVEERERLRRRYLGALERLATLLEARGDDTQAVLYAERLLRHDPLREATSRRLMRLYDARGERARAIRVYHVCAATLERELGVEPSAPTREAYEALLPVEREPAEEVWPVSRLGGPPLVGRAAHWARLTALWRASEWGRAQLVLLTGEPGVGKTRLVEELRSWCAHRGVVTAQARSYQAEGALAYGPVVAWLRTEALKAHLQRLDRVRLAELARLLPELYTEVPGLMAPEALPESDQRPRLFDALAAALLAPGPGLSDRLPPGPPPHGGPEHPGRGSLPLLLVADDLHWCDRETLRFLHYLLRVEPGARLLVAATARREEMDQQHPLHEVLAGLQAIERCTEIEVERLTREETTVLAARLSGYPLPEAAADQLYGETEGNPLFVVETLRTGWRGGAAERGRISPKVQAVIAARLSQLSAPARDLVGLAATIGRAFTSEVLAQAGGGGEGSDGSEETLVRGLDELWRRRIIREHGEQGAEGYDFSHDKIREVAYLTLSPARRRRNHLRVAQALERLHAHDPGAVSGQLAAHYERAGVAGQAVAWYRSAAEVAQQVHASAEGVRLLGRALDLLATLPETSERQAQELALLTALPAPLVALEGYASSRLTEVHRRALALCAALGVEPAPPLLRSLAMAGLARGDFEGAQHFGRQLHARGERDADDVLLVEGCYVLGVASFWNGELGAARRHFEAAVERYRPAQRRAHLLRYGQDPQVVCLTRLGYTLWFLGYQRAARHACDEALALADEIGHPYSRTSTLVFASLLALEMRDVERFRRHADVLAAGRREQEARQIQVPGEAIGGLLEVLDGRHEAGLARIQRTLEDAQLAEPAAPGMHAICARVLLEGCAWAGAARAGLAAAERALALGSAARTWEAEARRRRAEFLAALGAPGEAVEAELARALSVARQQGARMLELRVAESLLRQRSQRGDARGVREAQRLLAAITEGLPERLEGAGGREGDR